MSIWRESGLAMMIYLAGLKNIPTEINEAAIIDGAEFLAALPQCHRTVPRTGIYLLYPSVAGSRTAYV